ncbi:MAG: hypothetical protein AAB611_02005 [Patescibacteria group bacterium]
MKNMLGMNALAEVAGPLKDFAEKLGGSDGNNWLDAFKRFLRKENPWEGSIISIDRTKPFDPVAFIGKGWSVWRGPSDGNGLEGEEDQDERSLNITELDLSKIRSVTTLKGKEKEITGRENLKRLKASGNIRLDAKVFQTFWENQHLIPELWQEEVNGNIRFVYFEGTVLRSPSGNRCILFLFFNGGRWYWYYAWLGDGRNVDYPSAVLASA